jgi:hypothetical protein
MCISSHAYKRHLRVLSSEDVWKLSVYLSAATEVANALVHPDYSISKRKLSSPNVTLERAMILTTLCQKKLEGIFVMLVFNRATNVLSAILSIH